MLRDWLLTFMISVLLAGCQNRTDHTPTQEPTPTPRPTTENSDLPVILAFGDSLTAGHGVDVVNSYPSQLQKELDRLGYRYRVVNAGISGDTTSGGLSRIESALSIKPSVIILELGANDGLRGVPVRESRQNLDEMIVKSQKAGAEVILAGMTLPLNYGPDYIHDFERMYTDLARQHQIVLVPFFLEGVGGRLEFNQDDGIHPTAKGYTLIVQNILRYLEPLLNPPASDK